MIKHLYITDSDGEPISCISGKVWAEWIENIKNRRVARDQIVGVRGGATVVSTMFLGVDHNFGFAGPPLLWETLIMGGEYDGYMRRYSTRASALKGHAKAVEIVKGKSTS
jgi:hypothetical protein